MAEKVLVIKYKCECGKKYSTRRIAENHEKYCKCWTSKMDDKPIMVVFNPDKLVVLAGRPRKLTAKESKEYMQPGWEVKTMPFKQYKEANYKWIYDGKESVSDGD